MYSPATFWGELPEEIGAGCGEESHLFLVTTMQSGVGYREVDVDITTENDPECDQCLVGTWTLNLETFFKSYVRTLFEDDNIDFDLTEVSGGFRVTFTPGGIYYGEYDSLLIKYDVSTMGLGGTIGMGTTIYYDGSGLGTYFTDGETLQVVSGISTAKYQMSMGAGEGKIHDIPATGFGIGEDQPYTCNGDQLTFEKVDEGSGETLTYQYDRVKENK